MAALALLTAVHQATAVRPHQPIPTSGRSPPPSEESETADNANQVHVSGLSRWGRQHETMRLLIEWQDGGAPGGGVSGS